MNDRNGPDSFAPTATEMPLGGANWRTMMATFVTRMERDHEALLDTLRERLDEAESEHRRLEARVAHLEERLAEHGRATRRARSVAVRRPAPTPQAARAFPVVAPLPSGAPGAVSAPERDAVEAAGASASTAVPPGGAGWQDSARAILTREAELLTLARQGRSAVEIAGALGRGVGEVQLVLRLAERANVAVGQGPSHEEAM